MAECFPERLSWRWKEQVCQGVNVKEHVCQGVNVKEHVCQGVNVKEHVCQGMKCKGTGLSGGEV